MAGVVGIGHQDFGTVITRNLKNRGSPDRVKDTGNAFAGQKRMSADSK